VVIRVYKAIYIIALKAKTLIFLLNLFFKRLILFNKKQIKNINGIKTIKIPARRLRKGYEKKGKNKRTILTPVKINKK